MKKFKFIDLFAGIGGFHQAMVQLGGECVFASEIDKFCIDRYRENYGINSANDITEIIPENVPDHDVLCGGFPCQTFSKAGKQKGFEETRGTLFFYIEKILRVKKPKYIILENVRNLVSHDEGNTWRVIRQHLKDSGYRLTEFPIIISPHQIGVPQLRERVVILGIYDPENVDEYLKIDLDANMSKDDNSIDTILETDNNEEKYKISIHEEKVLSAWDEFYQMIDLKTIGFPIWADYFDGHVDEDYPEWKKNFIEKNHALYVLYKSKIDAWIKKWSVYTTFSPTQRKMEWQAGTKIKSIWEGFIQIRPSGIRVKAPTCFPALVAMVQVPIIGKYKRRLTIREAARLQSFPENFIHDENDHQAYKQFGNAVNVNVIKLAAEKLFEIQ
jgi:DNA (cytosine-5)-methyltransferase 1